MQRLIRPVNLRPVNSCKYLLKCYSSFYIYLDTWDDCIPVDCVLGFSLCFFTTGRYHLAVPIVGKLSAVEVLKACAEDVGFANIKKRLRAQGDRSGLRVFRFKPESGTFEDHWYTVDELNS